MHILPLISSRTCFSSEARFYIAANRKSVLKAIFKHEKIINCKQFFFKLWHIFSKFFVNYFLFLISKKYVSECYSLKKNNSQNFSKKFLNSVFTWRGNLLTISNPLDLEFSDYLVNSRSYTILNRGRWN